MLRCWLDRSREVSTMLARPEARGEHAIGGGAGRGRGSLTTAAPPRYSCSLRAAQLGDVVRGSEVVVLEGRCASLRASIGGPSACVPARPAFAEAIVCAPLVGWRGRSRERTIVGCEEWPKLDMNFRSRA